MSNRTTNSAGRKWHSAIIGAHALIGGISLLFMPGVGVFAQTLLFGIALAFSLHGASIIARAMYR